MLRMVSLASTAGGGAGSTLSSAVQSGLRPVIIDAARHGIAPRRYACRIEIDLGAGSGNLPIIRAPRVRQRIAVWITCRCGDVHTLAGIAPGLDARSS